MEERENELKQIAEETEREQEANYHTSKETIDNHIDVNKTETENISTKKAFPQKKKYLLIGLTGLVIAVIIAVPIYLNATFFDRLVSDMMDHHPYAFNERTSDYLKIDTNPFDKNIDDMTTDELIIMSIQEEDTLEAIEYVNEKLGFSSSVYDDMLHTSALMGRQRESNKKYTVSWSYHPDDGLEVKYEKN